MLYFPQGGTGVTCPPLPALIAPFMYLGRIFLWWSIVLVCCVVGIGGLRGVGDLLGLVPGALTRRGLALSRLPTRADEC